MTVTLIAILIGAISLQIKIKPIIYARIVAVSFLISAALSLNALFIEQISDGLGLLSGLFYVSTVSLSTEFIIYLTASLILIPWFIAASIPAAFPTFKGREDTPLNVKPNLTGPICSEYSLILLFSVLGGTLLISSSDLISMYLSIELQSFAVYILASLHKDNESSVASGLKYFLLGGLSSCFILLGAGLLYSYTGLTHIESIFSLILSSLPATATVETAAAAVTEYTAAGTAEALAGYSSTTSIIPVLGLLFIVTGFLFKIAAAPLHNWAPDVYDGVPSIVTTWLTIMPKISIVIFLLELVTVTFLGTGSDLIAEMFIWDLPFKTILLISSLLSLILGSIVGLAQFKIKRLLAYSTISHVGFLLLALAINSEASTESLLFYLFQYTFTNLNVFLILLAFGYTLKSFKVKDNTGHLTSTAPGNQQQNVAGSQPTATATVTALAATAAGAGKVGTAAGTDIKYIYELKGQFMQNPLLSLSFSVMLFSMAGIPPLLGFFAKQQVLLAANHGGYYFMSIIAILVSVISAYYYLQIIKVIHFSSETTTATATATATVTAPNSLISNSHSYIISILTLVTLLFILNPSIILNSVHLLALTLFSA